jgi:hypothetical protein
LKVMEDTGLIEFSAEFYPMDMPLADAQSALASEGFTMFDRPPTEGTSFGKEVVVCWPPLAEQNAPTPLRAQGAIATLFVKRGTVDGRDVATLIRNKHVERIARAISPKSFEEPDANATRGSYALKEASRNLARRGARAAVQVIYPYLTNPTEKEVSA